MGRNKNMIWPKNRELAELELLAEFVIAVCSMGVLTLFGFPFAFIFYSHLPVANALILYLFVSVASMCAMGTILFSRK